MVQSKKTAKLLMELGHTCTIEPLLKVEAIQNSNFQMPCSGILLTSSNAIPATRDHYSKSEREKIPVLTTGKSTAAAAEKAGFARVDYIQGSALDLVEKTPQWVDANQLNGDLPLLYPCAEQTAHDIPALLARKNIHCTAQPVYRTVPRDRFTDKTELHLEKGGIDAVMLYSKKTADAFCKLVNQAGYVLPDITFYLLSKEIAQSLPKGLGRKMIYPIKPEENDLLALINQ